MGGAMTKPSEPTADSGPDVGSGGIGGWQPIGGATIRAVPSMSDQFFRLAKNLRDLSRQHPNDISLPAGTVLIAIAALEAYVNELADMALRDADRRDFDALRDNLIKKLRLLNEPRQDSRQTRIRRRGGYGPALWAPGHAYALSD